MIAANNARLNKLLSKQYRTREGIKTLAQCIDDQLAKGNTFIVDKEHDAIKDKKIREQLSMISKRYVIAETWDLQQSGRGSNHNLPEVKKYWELLYELFDECFKYEYYISLSENTAMKIPKMVYDYYNNKSIAA